MKLTSRNLPPARTRSGSSLGTVPMSDLPQHPFRRKGIPFAFLAVH